MNEEIKKEKVWYKRWYVIVLLVVSFIIVISGMGGNSDNNSTPTPKTKETATVSEPTISKEQAQKDLDKYMPMAKTAGLLTSYDFSKLDDNTYRWDVFVGSNWYTQTVQQKKDFIAYIGLRKKAITGYSHFELRDGYTNEKVGEITAFSQSIEVYK
ncbi:MAG: hypothetical protein WC264_03385 [Candidatus Paceibacterota bacterium]|jgi:hypothetical protein